MRNFSQGYKTYEENEELISLKNWDLGELLLRRRIVNQHKIFDENPTHAHMRRKYTHACLRVYASCVRVCAQIDLHQKFCGSSFLTMLTFKNNQFSM